MLNVNNYLDKYLNILCNTKTYLIRKFNGIMDISVLRIY